MASYVTIKDAIEALKTGKKNSSVIVKVLSLGELATGTKKDGSQYKKMSAVVKDNSDVQELTLWDGDIGRVEAGKVYKLESPYWSFYKEKPQLGLGQYCTVHLASESDMLGQQTMQQSVPQPSSPTSTAGTPQVTSPTSPTATEPVPTVPIPKIDSGLQKFVRDVATELEQIRVEVEATMAMFNIPINGPHVGMIVSKCYDEWQSKKKGSV